MSWSQKSSKAVRIIQETSELLRVLEDWVLDEKQLSGSFSREHTEDIACLLSELRVYLANEESMYVLSQNDSRSRVIMDPDSRLN